ncbi:MAG: hypothetical protein GYB31_18225 [Bacteroidetes bacterium]|nr:hypothetical protein [Bacteroidota bacterium]
MNQRRTKYYLLFAFLLIAGTLAAWQQVSKADLREQRLQSRLENYRKASIEKCLEVIYEDAAAIVDSIMIERARAKRDTIGKPPKPERPDKPEIIPPKDSTPVRPMVDTIGGG